MPYKDPNARNAASRARYAKLKAEDPDFKRKEEERKAAYFQKRYKEDEKFREKRLADYQKWYAEHGGKDWQREHNGYVPWEEHVANLEAKRKARAAYMREWGKTEAGRRQKISQTIKKRGVTIEQYEQAYDSQQGKCWICGIWKEKYAVDRLSVDHCHTTGRFRALLCNNCNTAIGLLGEDPQVLLNAIRYLEEICPI